MELGRIVPWELFRETLETMRPRRRQLSWLSVVANQEFD